MASGLSVEEIQQSFLSPLLYPGLEEKLPPFNPPIPYSFLHLPLTVRDAPLILFFVKQFSIMHRLVTLAVQRGTSRNPVERAVWRYISDGDSGSLIHVLVTVLSLFGPSSQSYYETCLRKPKPKQQLECHNTTMWCVFNLPSPLLGSIISCP